jgi:hypothetical protein
MTEQPPSAEALELVSRLRKLQFEPGTAHISWHELNLLDAGKAIDALIGEHVAAEAERWEHRDRQRLEQIERLQDTVQSAAIRAFGQRAWSDTEEVAYQAGVSDTRAMLREPDVREAVYEAVMSLDGWRPDKGGLNVVVAYDIADAAITQIVETLK